MKNLKTFAVSASSAILLLAGGNALAQTGNFGAVTVANCTAATVPIISSDVTVQSSKNVSGAYACRIGDATATPATVNRVGLGTCHSAGMAKARSVTCTRTTDGAPTPTYTYTPTKCTAANFDGTSLSAKAGADGQVQVSGVTIFTTSTSGGSIGTDGMGNVVCAAAGVLAQVEAAYP
jgi:hypothetical protein